MSNNKTLSVPIELVHPFFFAENEEITIHVEEMGNLYALRPFLYETAFFSGVQAVKPWEIQEKSIPVLIEEWQKVKELLETLFAKREMIHVLAPMKKGISLLLELVYWGNGLPVVLSNLDLDKLAIKPVNLSERLEFIMKKPSLYHSYIQLAELIGEMNKQYVKQQIMKKASKP
ncbi:YpoC family protein [Bacillus sp. JJ1532]|uniref:YpoC family protein n=1 Tax=Bacillus sp. JJ1532 TaxID=3122958 RepID=UPI003000F4FC